MSQRLDGVRVRSAHPDRQPARRPRADGAVQLGFARHHGGTFVFRIEDTDNARNTEESYDGMIEVMQWLGLDWDEGPLKGGRLRPYRQSERTDIYTDVLAQLRGTRFTYDCYCTTEEVDARRKASGSKVMGYDGFCRDLTDEQRRWSSRQDGRKPVVRFRMPDGSLTWDDLVRGEITFETEHVPDFALCRANGDPLYTLVNPVDDALMEITHVLRGEDLLSSTPRQLALYEALTELGIAKAGPASSATCPTSWARATRSCRSGTRKAHLIAYRDDGFLPEGLLNYLALLGWAICRRPRRLHPRRDGGGVRDRRRQPQPGALRREEGRRDQRRAHADAVGRGDHRAGAAVPRGRGRPRPGRRCPTGSCSTWRCRWSPSGSTS